MEPLHPFVRNGIQPPDNRITGRALVPDASAPPLPENPSSSQKLDNTVRQLLLKNVRDGYSRLLGRHYCYVAPSPETYPFQWFWDTCFHVLILTRLGEFEAAKRNLRSLFSMQGPDGFVGHMIFWHQLLPKRHTDVLQARPCWENLRPHMSGLIQPTFAAQALLRLFEACDDRVYLGEMYARVKRYHDWLARNRDFDGDSLITIISPFESGMDWKPSYDEVLGYEARRTPAKIITSPLFWKGVAIDASNFVARYDLQAIKKRAKFLVKDVAVNAIYANDLRALETLGAIVGDSSAPAYRHRRLQVEHQILAKMYDEDDAAFYDIREPGAKKLRTVTPTIFFPLALESIPQAVADRVIERHVGSGVEFNTNFPVPSVARNDPSYFPGESPFIWRGPTWAFLNWFLYHAFRRRGYHAHAERLKQSLQDAIAASGFREYYNPCNGEGYGARQFTWSGLVVDMV